MLSIINTLCLELFVIWCCRCARY